MVEASSSSGDISRQRCYRGERQSLQCQTHVKLTDRCCRDAEMGGTRTGVRNIMLRVPSFNVVVNGNDRRLKSTVDVELRVRGAR
jgi:hypothetical protein